MAAERLVGPAIPIGCILLAVVLVLVLVAISFFDLWDVGCLGSVIAFVLLAFVLAFLTSLRLTDE
jgi:hypothetical protein